jgi:MFS superfamily sulfate permease-like transporter
VIVRSSANVQAGAMTRASAILHGLWILAFVALLPWLLREIPMASLAAVLVVTGWRLVHVGHVTSLFKNYGLLPALIWAATLILVVAEDLLTGVLVGIALSLLEVVPHLRKPGLRVDASGDDEALAIRVEGVASILTLPKLAAALERAPATGPIKLDLSSLRAVDHTSAEMIRDWLNRRKTIGMPVRLTGADPRLATLFQ